MNKLKGIKDINLFLDNWLLINGFYCTCKFGTDFSYDYINDIITYAFVLPEDDTNSYLNYCEKYIPGIKDNDPFIISFFHELGHFITQSDFSESEWNKYNKLCDKLDKKDKLTNHDYIKYYSNIVEDSATAWACDYILDNPDIIEKWWNELQPLIVNFMKLNNIEDS